MLLKIRCGGCGKRVGSKVPLVTVNDIVWHKLCSDYTVRNKTHGDAFRSPEMKSKRNHVEHVVEPYNA